MLKSFIVNLWTGELTKHQLMCAYLPAFFCMTIGWAISRWLYPGEGGFGIESQLISSQGTLSENPEGSPFFIFSTVIMGGALSFFFIYLFNQLKPGVGNLLILMRRLGVSGGIGLMMVGIFQGGGVHVIFKTIHLMGAVLAFLGLSLGAFLSMTIIFLQIIRNESRVDTYKFIIVCFLLLFFILMLGSTNQPSIIEWTGLYTIVIWANSLILILPGFNDLKMLKS